MGGGAGRGRTCQAGGGARNALYLPPPDLPTAAVLFFACFPVSCGFRPPALPSERYRRFSQKIRIDFAHIGGVRCTAPDYGAREGHFLRMRFSRRGKGVNYTLLKTLQSYCIRL